MAALADGFAVAARSKAAKQLTIFNDIVPLRS
jgi:hypothetical protein